MNYSNPMVTYDEIIQALKAILDCSKANGYLDDYSVLNAKYDTIEKSPLQEEQEQALRKAIEALERVVDEGNKVIREELEKELKEIAASNIFKISTRYLDGEEKRKLAAQEEFVKKLGEVSLPLSSIKVAPVKVEEEVPLFEQKGFDLFEEIIDDEEEEKPKEEEPKEEPKKEFDFDFAVPRFEESMPSLSSKEETPETKEVPAILPKEELLSQESYPSNIHWEDTSRALSVNEEQYQKLQSLDTKAMDPIENASMAEEKVIEPSKRPVGRPKST